MFSHSCCGRAQGLGDFIFYSVLAGRAAMHSMLAALVCYLAIIGGLGATLMLLALHKRALPALPVSIALGMLAYLVTRFSLEPVVLPLTTQLLMY